MTKAYRKPSGHYIELEDQIPVSNQLVEVAIRPSSNHKFTNNWDSDPLNPAICWEPKEQSELDAEEDEEAKGKFMSEREDTLLMILYLADKQLREIRGDPEIDKETFWDQIKNVHKNQQFFDGSF